MPRFLEFPFFEERTVELAAGNSVLLYSDGIIEASNLQGEEYGMEWLKQSFTPESATIENLIVSVQNFASPNLLTDDATVLMVERRSGADGPAR